MSNITLSLKYHDYDSEDKVVIRINKNIAELKKIKYFENLLEYHNSNVVVIDFSDCVPCKKEYIKNLFAKNVNFLGIDTDDNIQHFNNIPIYDVHMIKDKLEFLCMEDQLNQITCKLRRIKTFFEQSKRI